MESRYLHRKKLKKTGYSELLLKKDVETKKDCIMNVLSAAEMLPENYERELIELKKICDLTHENLIKYTDVFLDQDKNQCNLVMEVFPSEHRLTRSQRAIQHHRAAQKSGHADSRRQNPEVSQRHC